MIKRCFTKRFIRYQINKTKYDDQMNISPKEMLTNFKSKVKELKYGVTDPISDDIIKIHAATSAIENKLLDLCLVYNW